MTAARIAASDTFADWLAVASTNCQAPAETTVGGAASASSPSRSRSGCGSGAFLADRRAARASFRLRERGWPSRRLRGLLLRKPLGVTGVAGVAGELEPPGDAAAAAAAAAASPRAVDFSRSQLGLLRRRQTGASRRQPRACLLEIARARRARRSGRAQLHRPSQRAATHV